MMRMKKVELREREKAVGMQSTRERAQKMGAPKNKYMKTKQNKKNKNGKNDEENFRSREEAERKKKTPKKFNENFKTTHAQNAFRFRFLSQILNG